jgi:hypothetical protein
MNIHGRDVDGALSVAKLAGGGGQRE